MTRKGFAPIIILLFVASLLVVATFLYSYQTQQAYPGPLPVSTSSAALGGVPTSTASSSLAQPNPSGTNNNGVGQNQGKPIVVRKIPDLGIEAYDLSSDPLLMGASHNVFVARVIKELGLSQTEIPPITQFAVDVVFNIKGNLQGTVTVEQVGGYNNGILYVSNGDTFGPSNKYGAGYLLQPGSTYLLATTWHPGDIFGLLTSPNASKLISEDGTLSNAQLRNVAMNDDRVIQLERAYPNEILDPADVRTGNARNSYQSLSVEQKAALPQPPPPVPPPPPPPPAPTSTASSTGK